MTIWWETICELPWSIYQFCGVFVWEISARSTEVNSRNTAKMMEHKLVLFATVTALWSLVTLLTYFANSHTPKEVIHTRPKLCHFGLYVVRATLFCLKSFVPVTGLECPYGKIVIPFTESSVAKAASPAFHMSTSTFLQRKGWRGEISETEPARLTGLIWRGPKEVSTTVYELTYLAYPLGSQKWLAVNSQSKHCGLVSS